VSGPSGPFFIGWASAVPPTLRAFLVWLSVALLGLAALLGLLLSVRIDDPGRGAFDWAAGEQTLRGVLSAAPYPLLILPPSPAHPNGHAVLLGGEGKNGAAVAPTLDGREVEATGFVIRRGDIEMLQVSGDPGLRPVGPPPALVPPALVPPPVPLGRWRLVGEICDGKCYAGAMRPGAGIAHRACAGLCLTGGLPPVLVTTGPVDGTSFLLLAGVDGGPVAGGLARLAGLRLRLDGRIERHADLLVLRADPASVQVP
jgi:hypothetical protein